MFSHSVLGQDMMICGQDRFEIEDYLEDIVSSSLGHERQYILEKCISNLIDDELDALGGSLLIAMASRFDENM